jgi:hypothetical protein
MDVELQIRKHLAREAQPTVSFIDKYCVGSCYIPRVISVPIAICLNSSSRHTEIFIETLIYKQSILPIRPDVPLLLAEGFIKLRDKLLVLSGVGDKDVDHAPI